MSEVNGKHRKKPGESTGQEREGETEGRPSGKDGAAQAAASVSSSGGEDIGIQEQTHEQGVATGAQIRELQARVEELAAQNAALQDEVLRKAAEFENFRKRMFRDKEEAIRYANAALLSDVLPIIDDFERAIQTAAGAEAFAAFHEGVSLIEKQLVSILERNWGLKRFSAEGEIFDPQQHEAIAAEETDRHEDPIVLEEYQRGYLLHDRVLRPAKVKVAKPAASDERGSNKA